MWAYATAVPRAAAANKGDGFNHRRGHPGGTMAFAQPVSPASVSISTSEEVRVVVPGARIGEELRQRRLEHVGPDFGDLHRGRPRPRGALDSGASRDPQTGSPLPAGSRFRHRPRAERTVL
jgi:hypothetical protein